MMHDTLLVWPRRVSTSQALLSAFCEGRTVQLGGEKCEVHALPGLASTSTSAAPQKSPEFAVHALAWSDVGPLAVHHPLHTAHTGMAGGTACRCSSEVLFPMMKGVLL